MPHRRPLYAKLPSNFNRTGRGLWACLGVNIFNPILNIPSIIDYTGAGSGGKRRLFPAEMYDSCPLPILKPDPYTSGIGLRLMKGIIRRWAEIDRVVTQMLGVGWSLGTANRRAAATAARAGGRA